MTSYHHEIYNKSGFLFCRLRNRIFTIPDENESFTLRGKNFRRSLKTKASLGDRRIHADLGAASAPSGIMQWRSKIWRAGWNVHWLSTATELELFSGVPCNEMAKYVKFSKRKISGLFKNHVPHSSMLWFLFDFRKEIYTFQSDKLSNFFVQNLFVQSSGLNIFWSGAAT